MDRNESLIQFRLSRNMSTEDMAKELRISRSFYEKIEWGKRNPSFNFIKKFKAKFKVDVDKLFFKQTTRRVW